MKRILILGATALLAVSAIACTDASAIGGGGTATTPPGVSVGEPTPNGGGTPPASPDGSMDTKIVIAPTLEAEIQSGAAGSGQYSLRVVSEIGDGCHQFERVDVTRDGDVIDVTVLRTTPAHPEVVVCTMLYQTHEETVSLGDDFESGHEYTVTVNDGERTLTFVAS
ncbi:MAG: hypothetical protein O3B31_08500 [Chloroflexi bacterium]|nr:hypothetical protein [Chloroflexota bacterium]MDA1003369.1 hypothetical protein [Chloroflexota bacterium]